jgi:hypothetical protein
MVNQPQVLGTIDRLALKRGEKKGNFYYLTVTTGELLEAFDLKPSLPHHRHVKGLVEMNYHGTTAEGLGRGDGSDGFKLYIKIRSR